MPKVRVLLLLHELTLTGASMVILDVFENMKDQVDLNIIALRGGPLEDRWKALGNIRMCSDLPSWGPFLNRIRLKVMRIFWSLSFRLWKPDLIYVNTAVALEIVRILKMPSVPVMLHLHEMGTSLKNFVTIYQDLLVKWPTQYIAVCEPMRNSLIHEYGIRPEKIALIHEFVYSERVSQIAEGMTEGGTSGAFVIGGSGYASWCKGNILWLQVAVELKKIIKEQSLRFIWVGMRDDAEGRQFKEMIRKMGLEGDIEVVAVTAEPLKYFSRFDVFSMTSWEDSCPIVVLENMLLKKPVVCFRGGGGAPEEVGDTGIVIETFSPRLMAEEIAKLAADRQRRKAMGEAAYQRVCKYFAASSQIPKIREEIFKLIALERQS